MRDSNPIDAPDPETFDEFPDEGAEPEAGSEQWEAPEADAAEQRRELLRRREEPPSERFPEFADPADAAEQARVVDLDDEDYR